MGKLVVAAKIYSMIDKFIVDFQNIGEGRSLPSLPLSCAWYRSYSTEHIRNLLTYTYMVQHMNLKESSGRVSRDNGI